MPDWLPIFQAVGLPGTILLMLAFAGWKIIPWIGTRVDRFVSRHIQFVDEVQISLTTVVKQFQDTSIDLKKISDAQAKLAEAQAKLTESQARLSDNTLQTLKAAQT